MNSLLFFKGMMGCNSKEQRCNGRRRRLVNRLKVALGAEGGPGKQDYLFGEIWNFKDEIASRVLKLNRKNIQWYDWTFLLLSLTFRYTSQLSHQSECYLISTEHGTNFLSMTLCQADT